MAQRTISFAPKGKRRSDVLHIEAPGAIVNISCHTDSEGREVTRVSISADGNRYSGDPEWWVDGVKGNSGVAVRVVCLGREG